MKTVNEETLKAVLEVIFKDKDTYTFENFLKERNLMSDVQYKGSNMVIPCPFHTDESPSMSIDPNKKIFKCFSCGRGGNYISFLVFYNQIKMGIKSNFYDTLNSILLNDKSLQLRVGASSIFKEAKMDFKEFNFKRNKVDLKNISAVPTSILEFASKMIKEGKNDYPNIKMFILLIQSGMPLKDIHEAIFSSKEEIDNVDNAESYGENFDINSLLGGD